MKQEFIRKESTLLLVEKATQRNLGQTNFDFSDYVGQKAHKKLPLTGGPDPEAYIEIQIRAKLVERDESPSGRSEASRMVRGPNGGADDSIMQDVTQEHLDLKER